MTIRPAKRPEAHELSKARALEEAIAKLLARTTGPKSADRVLGISYSSSMPGH